MELLRQMLLLKNVGRREDGGGKQEECSYLSILLIQFKQQQKKAK